MKKTFCHLLFTCIFTLFTSHALAAKWGVLPIPANMSSLKQEDIVSAIDKVTGIGANVNVTLLGWHDLEPNPEVYDIFNRLGMVEYADKRGMSTYFGVSVINTTRRDMPDDLKDLPWSDPRILERFTKLIEAASKKLPKTVTHFIIGNEVDVYFEQHPKELRSYLDFYVQAREVVRQYYPQALIGISVTFEGVYAKPREEIIATILEASDAAFFTFYPVYSVPPAPKEDIPKMLDALIDASQGKDIILQEVGFPTTSVIQSSPELQAEFFKVVIPEINQRPRISVASIFALHDLEPKFCDLLTNYYGFENSSIIRDFLCTLGVHDYTGNPKPAWDVIVKALSEAKNVTEFTQ